ncbi:MAG TPA: glycerophosphodiester phosphodiesterase family protein [Solirubrobacteraceae bacterium]|nr:glycerophosphodiester phosphodiesterase family protein [Solirubrobacteraceae bacterium]
MNSPIVIAHRGASAHRPEHTLAAYELAIELGADFIEPDVVATRDGVLVARHENEISGTTDIAQRPELADRRTVKEVDGLRKEGWFTEDLTLEELRSLRARERLPGLRGTRFDGRFAVPTLDEVIALAARAGVGVYPETKHPSYFAGLGLALEPPLLAALEGFGGPVFIQSFEAGNLRALRGLTDHPLVRLTVGAAPDVAEIAGYAHAIGPHKDQLIPRTADGRLGEPTSLVADAHAAGLLVHPWTFRPEPEFLPAGLDGDQELDRFLALGVDGVFADDPGAAVAARSRTGK